MKKTVIIILAILPLFLVVAISFAAKILSLYEHIEVENVMFVDEDNKEYKANYIFKLNVGEEKQTHIKIIPELASNKNVKYSSTDESVCTIDENGVAKGLKFGQAVLVVKTEDNGLYALLIVKVEEKRVTGISFPVEEIEITIGEPKTIKATIIPATAEDKGIEYSSKNPDFVEIDSLTGELKAIKEGTATIEAKSNDGGFVATCVVICKSGVPPILFDLSSNANFIKQNDVYKHNFSESIQINLRNYLQIDSKKVIIEEIRFEIIEGSSSAEVNAETGELIIHGNGMMQIPGTNSKRGMITIRAYVGESLEDSTYSAELKIALEQILK